MYKHMDVHKVGRTIADREAWRHFMLQCRFPEEFVKWSIEGITTWKGKPVVMTPTSFGTYCNTVGRVTLYCSWGHPQAGECWQLNWDWDAQTEQMVGQPHWLKVR